MYWAILSFDWSGGASSDLGPKANCCKNWHAPQELNKEKDHSINFPQN